MHSPQPLNGPPQRSGADRRQTRTRWWAAFALRGRRLRQRRTAEHQQPYYVDRFPSTTFVFILLLLLFTIADGVLTLYLLDGDCAEMNPVMESLLNHGMGPFLLGKYVLTVLGLPVLLVFKNFYLFGTRFRVGYLIPIFVALYAGLIGYQVYLLQLVFR